MFFNEIYIYVVILGGYNRGNNLLLLMGFGINMVIYYFFEMGYWYGWLG